MCLWHHSRDLGRICVEEKKRRIEGRKEGKWDAQQATGRVRLLSTFKDDFKQGVTDRSDKALEVLLSSTRRKPMVIFSARALARPRSRRGLVPTPGAVIFAELPSLLGGDLPLYLSLSPRRSSARSFPYTGRFLSSSLLSNFLSVSLSLFLCHSFCLALHHHVRYVRWQCASLSSCWNNNNACTQPEAQTRSYDRGRKREGKARKRRAR